MPETATTETERTIREEFATVMPESAPGDPAGARLDPDRDLADAYGLGSLDKVLFLTAVCDRLQVSLATFTEVDLAGLRTLGDVVAAMAARRTSVVQP